MSEFDVKKGSACLEDKTPIVDKGGSLKTADEYEQISSGQTSLKLGKLPYFRKSPKFEKSSIFLRACVP